MVIDEIYKLRENFILIGLTGKTGSGCTTVANILKTSDVSSLKTNYEDFREGQITNQVRKDRIVHNFINENWVPFTVIRASNVICYLALRIPFDELVRNILQINRQRLIWEEHEKEKGSGKKGEKTSSTDDIAEEEFNDALDKFKDCREVYENLSAKINRFEEFLDNKFYSALKEEDKREEHKEILDSIDSLFDVIDRQIPAFRDELSKPLNGYYPGLLPYLLQTWGNNLRLGKDIRIDKQRDEEPDPAFIAYKINQLLKCLTAKNKLLGKNNKTRVVIDALRNPLEILYFRERYSAFYCMAVNVPDEARKNNLLKNKHFRIDEIEALDKKESEKKDVRESFQEIDIVRCISNSDIFVSHNPELPDNDRNLNNQLLTYISLILHPGLIPPTPQERIMQMAYTAKLNSGCLSRQVGAAVTDSNFSIKAIGWNSVPEGQVPCSLRSLEDLTKKEDADAFSDFERKNVKFIEQTDSLLKEYRKKNLKLKGRGLTYCFKDVYSSIEEKHYNNQVHTRSLHAEENAFLQITKHGGNPVEGGKLFTTASCCELCSKKAYHLGIKEIYYIDSYPGISYDHIFQAGKASHRPKVILFSGVIGRAYINLYNPFFPYKDELETLSDTEVKKFHPAPEKGNK